jgi:seryl-tRNA synthetase
MLDIALIREQPERVRDALQTLGADRALVDPILALDVRRRELLTEVEALRAERNRVSKQIGRMRDQAGREPLIAEMRQVGDRISVLEKELREVQSDLEVASPIVTLTMTMTWLRASRDWVMSTRLPPYSPTKRW